MFRLSFSSFFVAGSACALRDGRVRLSWEALLASADSWVLCSLADNLAILVEEDNKTLNVGKIESSDLCPIHVRKIDLQHFREEVK